MHGSIAVASCLFMLPPTGAEALGLDVSPDSKASSRCAFGYPPKVVKG